MNPLIKVREEEPKQLSPVKRIITEELNLCEFPFTALTTQRNFTPLKFSDTITLKGQKIQREWTVDGSLRYGTPIAIDELAFLVGISLFDENAYEGCFSTYQFCKAAKWATSGHYYKIFYDSSLRLGLANIDAKCSFWKKEGEHKGKYLARKVFHLLDEVKLYGMEKTGDEETDEHIWDFNYNYWKLSKTIFESIKAGNIKPTNLDFYLSLEKPISRRQYRFYDKKFYNQGILHLNVETLAHEHIGLSRNTDLWDIKHKLDKGHAELAKANYLKTWKYKENVLIIERAPLKNIVSVSIELKNKKTNSARELVNHFHTQLGRGDAQVSPLELKQAGKLIRDYGPNQAKEIVRFALSKRNTTEPCVFGYVITHLNDAVKELVAAKERNDQETKKQEEQARQQEEAKKVESEKQKLLNFFASLSEETQDQIQTKADKIFKEEYHSYGGELSREFALLEAIRTYKKCPAL